MYIFFSLFLSLFLRFSLSFSFFLSFSSYIFFPFILSLSFFLSIFSLSLYLHIYFSLSFFLSFFLSLSLHFSSPFFFISLRVHVSPFLSFYFSLFLHLSSCIYVCVHVSFHWNSESMSLQTIERITRDRYEYIEKRRDDSDIGVEPNDASHHPDIASGRLRWIQKLRCLIFFFFLYTRKPNGTRLILLRVFASPKASTMAYEWLYFSNISVYP